MSDGPQDEVLAFLSNGDAFGGTRPERIDTHASYVFLTGDRAYKMKRAVKLEFLDYSTQDARQHFCRQEIELNRRFAPDLYLGVAAVRRTGDGLILDESGDGQGDALDWLVVMARFDGDKQFDRMAEAGRLTPAMMDELADTVCAGHRQCPIRRDHGDADSFSGFLQTIAHALERFSDRPDIAEPAEQFLAAARADRDRLAPLIEARRRHGFVRRAHGDMHLANICLYQGRATPFDAIEFSDEIAATDLLYDLAFPLMDLIREDKRDLANRLMNRYLSAARDYGGLRPMPFFLALRAGIRAMTRALAPDAAERTDAIAQHIALADRMLAGRPTPCLIAIGGRSGSGKSTLAMALAPDWPGPGAVVLRSDLIRKRLAQVPPEQALGPDGYAPGMTDRVYRTQMKDARRALAAGWPVILDASFQDEDRRCAAAALAARHAVPFFGFWLELSEEEAVRRVSARTGDPSDADAAVVARQYRQDPGDIRWAIVDAEAGQADMAQTVRNRLGGRRG